MKILSFIRSFLWPILFVSCLMISQAVAKKMDMKENNRLIKNESSDTSLQTGLKNAREKNVWTHEKIDLSDYKISPENLLTKLKLNDDLLYNDPKGEVNLFLMYWGEEPFPYGLYHTKTIDYTSSEDVGVFSKIASLSSLAITRQSIFQDEDIDWNSTVVFNGAKFENTSSSCTNNPNIQIKQMAAYVRSLDYDEDNETLTFEPRAVFDANGDFDFKMFYTKVRANKKYMRFWQNHMTIEMSDSGTVSARIGSDSKYAYPVSMSPSCDEYNKCTLETTVYLTVPDYYGHTMDSDFVESKKAFVILRGFNFSHEGDSRKFRDAYVEMTLSDTSVDDAGRLPLKITIDFNGKKTPKALWARVYFTVGVYDPDYVTYKTLDSVSGESFSTDGTYRYLIDAKSVSLPWSSGGPKDTNCQDDGCKKELIPMFVANRSWGFDLDDQYEVHRVRGVSRLYDWNDQGSGSGIVKVKYMGEMYRKGCLTTSQAVNKANKMRSRFIICKNTDVCQASYDSVVWENVASSKSSEKEFEFPVFSDSLVEFADFLENEFYKSTRGLLTLNVNGNYAIRQPKDFDKDFLDIIPIDEESCEYLKETNSDSYATCTNNARKTYAEWPLSDDSEIRYYYYESEGGKENDSNMFETPLERAKELGWDEDSEILMIIVNAKIESLGYYNYAKKFATMGQPYEQGIIYKEVPYETNWNNAYYVADEVIHEVGHAMGLGHDCQYSDGNYMSDDECSTVENIMSHHRSRPQTDEDTYVNDFSECDLNYLENTYLNKVSNGGPYGSAIEDFSCF